MENRIATAVLVLSPEGIPLVKDPSKPEPVRWKLPGGKGKEIDEQLTTGALRESTDGEKALLSVYPTVSDEFPTAVACAARELQEETHIAVTHNELCLLSVERRKYPQPHWYFVFGVYVEDVYKRGLDLNKLGNEGEKVGLFDPCIRDQCLDTMLDFFAPHREILKRPETLKRIKEMIAAFAS